MLRRFSRRRTLVAGAAAVAACLAASLAVGPAIRATVQRFARQRGLTVRSKSVALVWGGVLLRDVAIAGSHPELAHAQLSQVRVELAWPFRVGAIEVVGAELGLHGHADGVAEELGRWRGSSRGDDPARGGLGPKVSVVDGSVQWVDSDSGREISFIGLSVERNADEVRVRARDAHASDGHLRAEVTGLDMRADSRGTLERFQASTATVEWLARQEVETGVGVPALQAANESAVGRTEDFGAARLGRAIDEATSLLSGHTATDLEARVDALTWRFSSMSPPLTLGPGPFAITRSSAAIDVRYSADTTASSTSLRCAIRLPVARDEASLTLQGGPVTLAQLGIAEGAAGLLGVRTSDFTGGARVVFDRKGGSLVFDAEGALRGVGLHDERVAPEDIRGLDVSFAVRGAASEPGVLRLDALRARLGAAELTASGTIERRPDSWAAAVALEVPTTACGAAIASIPTALVPALQGSVFDGTFAAHGRLAFDTRDLDALSLTYDVRDGCRARVVPMALARDRFQRPFEQRIYLPDGTTGSILTGPGTPEWTPLDSISPYLQIAVLTTEDGAFYRHRGYSSEAIRASVIANLKAGRFVRGASTISMQLAKNLFLPRAKTLSRKLQEIILTDYLEQEFTKDELMELYLNVVELGPTVYGVTEAADYYFGRTPAELSLPECFFLATLLPSPIRHSKMRERDHVPDGWMHTIQSLMTVAHKRGLISDAELADAIGDTVVFWHGGPRPPARPPVPRRHLGGFGDDDIEDHDGP